MEVLSVTEGFEMVVVLYTVKEAATWLKEKRQISCAPGYLSRCCKEGELPAMMVGRSYLISQQNLEKFKPKHWGRPRKD